MSVYRRYLLVCICLLVVSMIFPHVSEAKITKMDSFGYQVINNQQGMPSLRLTLTSSTPIEEQGITLNKDALIPNMLVVNIPQAKLGKVKSMYKLDGKIGNKIFFNASNSKLLQLKIYVNIDLNKAEYKFTVNSSKNKGKVNYHINIEITPNANNTIWSTLKNKVIVLDPGHGGSDSGAVGPQGIMEKDVTLAIAKDLQRQLIASGARVIMTRTTDVDVYGPHASAAQELGARANVGEINHADIFISIHANSFTSPQANGTQVFYLKGSTTGLKLAEAIQHEMVKATGLRNRHATPARFYVLRYSTMPAVLVETAFISNPQEELMLRDPKWQQRMATAIGEGLATYLTHK